MEDTERRRLRAALEEVAGCDEPRARLLLPPEAPRWRRVAVLPGAFHPPTAAHVALARAALGRGFEAALFSLGTTTIDKPVEGLPLEERARLLAAAAAEPGLGVVLQNRGLYAEQAAAFHRAFPGLEDLAFAVGMDKVGQIFDPRYYDDMPRALEALFSRARLLVAPRGSLGPDDLGRLLDRPEARPFRERVEWLALDPRWSDVSATAVREAVARGEDPSGLLPPAVAERLRRLRAGRG